MPTQQLKALVVDDDPIVRRTLGFALGKEGFACLHAASGDEALAQLRDEQFDLVVTDLRMPGKNGHALAVEILAGKDRPVIVVHSSLDDPRLVKDLMARGVDDFIQKPTNYGAFAAKIKMLVERRRTSEPQAAKAALPAPKASRPARSSGLASRHHRHAGGSFACGKRSAGDSRSRPPGVASPNGRAMLRGRMALSGRRIAGRLRSGRLPHPSMFGEVLCHEISTTGISFFLPRPPGFQLAVITLGRSTERMSMLIRVVHSAVVRRRGPKTVSRERSIRAAHFQPRVARRTSRGAGGLAHVSGDPRLVPINRAAWTQ